MLTVIGFLFGAAMWWTRRLQEQEIKQIGAQTGGRTLLFGGWLFAASWGATLLGLDRLLPVDGGTC